MVELGSAPATVLFVPMPRMVTCAAPVCCEIVTAGTKPARPSTVWTPSCSSVLAGSTVIAMGVDWISAAPVFVAVTVTLSENEETASTRSSVARRALHIDVGAPRLEPAERGRDQVAACGERIEHVFAVLVRDHRSWRHQSRAGDGQRHTR